MASKLDPKQPLELARAIVSMPDSELVETIHDLRRRETLTTAVHALNECLRHPTQHALAHDAIKRIGLLCGG